MSRQVSARGCLVVTPKIHGIEPFLNRRLSGAVAVVCTRGQRRVFRSGVGPGRGLAEDPGGAHVTVRSVVLRLCALGLLVLLNAMTPQAGIAVLASCLAHLPGPATADSDPTV